MTRRQEGASIGLAALGALMILGSLAWALPGYVALGVGGLLLVLLGVGTRHARRVLQHGIAGLEELEKEDEAPP